MLKEESVAYSEYADQIERACLQHQRLYGGDLHVYQSAADLCFFQARASYDPEKGPFAAYLGRSLNNRLKSTRRTSYYWWWKSRIVEDLHDCLQVTPQPTEVFSVQRFAFELSDDAAFLIRDLFDNIAGDGELSFNSSKIAHQRSVLQRRARKQGWTRARLSRVFEEIQQALKGDA